MFTATSLIRNLIPPSLALSRSASPEKERKKKKKGKLAPNFHLSWQLFHQCDLICFTRKGNVLMLQKRPIFY